MENTWLRRDLGDSDYEELAKPRTAVKYCNYTPKTTPIACSGTMSFVSLIIGFSIGIWRYISPRFQRKFSLIHSPICNFE